MPNIPRVGDLEIEQDPALVRRMQTVQRVGWAVFALVVLAALLGLFGTGLFSKAGAGDPGGPLSVEYDRGLRYQAREQLRVRLGPGAVRDGKARVWLSDGYLDRVQIRRIDPSPETVELGPGGQTFVFAARALTEPATVMFYLEPEKVGPLSGEVRLDGGPALPLRQFVYP
jgi:hypothetical protein